MGIIPQGSLFSWRIVDGSPDIVRLQQVLRLLPDRELIAALEAERKGQRDDYPLKAMWNSLITGVVAPPRVANDENRVHLVSLRRVGDFVDARQYLSASRRAGQ